MEQCPHHPDDLLSPTSHKIERSRPATHAPHGVLVFQAIGRQSSEIQLVSAQGPPGLLLVLEIPGGPTMGRALHTEGPSQLSALHH